MSLLSTLLTLWRTLLDIKDSHAEPVRLPVRSSSPILDSPAVIVERTSVSENKHEINVATGVSSEWTEVVGRKKRRMMQL
ncbi:hypothetical protein P5V15_001132 [Pogonomyrmex californicus]